MCNLIIYTNTCVAFCWECDAILEASRNAVRRHMKAKGCLTYFATIRETLPTKPPIPRGTEWIYPVVANDLQRIIPYNRLSTYRLQNVKVCSICGFTLTKLSKNGVKQHQMQKHGPRMLTILEGTAFILKGQGCILKHLKNVEKEDSVRDVQKLLLPELQNEDDEEEEEENDEEENDEEENDEEENDPQTSAENEEAIVREIIREFAITSNHICNKALVASPSPRKRSRVCYTTDENPSTLDLGIFTSEYDLHPARLKWMMTLVDDECTEAENIISRCFIEAMKQTPMLLMEVDTVTRKSLTTSNLKNLQNEEDEYEIIVPNTSQGRGFSPIHGLSLEKYSEIAVRLVVVIQRILGLGEVDSKFLGICETELLKGLHPDETVENINPFFVGHMMMLMKHIPTYKEPIIITALRVMSVREVKLPGLSDEVITYEMKPIHELSYMFAAVKYCLTSMCLGAYVGLLDSGEDVTPAHRKTITAWTSSRTFNILNGLIYKTKKLQMPGTAKVELAVSSLTGRSGVNLLVKGQQLSLEQVQCAIGHIVNVIKDKLIDIFGDDIKQYFYPSTSKNLKLQFRDGMLSFTDEVPDIDADAVLNIRDEDIYGDIIDKKDKMIKDIYENNNLLLALCDLCGTGHRRAAEFRDFIILERNKTETQKLFLRPNPYCFADIRRIFKRASNDKLGFVQPKIRHCAVVSNLLVVNYYFSNKLLYLLEGREPCYRFFPIPIKPLEPLLEKLKIKFGGASQNPKPPLIDRNSYSEIYSNKANFGYAVMFQSWGRAKITMTTIRQMHTQFQNSLKKMDHNFEDFLAGMDSGRWMRRDRHLAESSGHSVTTRRIWYTAQNSFDGRICPKLTSEDEEKVATQWEYLILGFAPVHVEEEGWGNNEDIPANAVEIVCRAVGFQSPKNDLQRQLIMDTARIVLRTDRRLRCCVASLSCGSGKSIAIDTALKFKRADELVILVLPTHALIDDKKAHYSRNHRVQEYETGFNNFASVDLLILTFDKAFSQVFIDAFLHIRSIISCLIIDEAHTLLDSTFRTVMYRSEYLIQYHVPTLFLSGSLPRIFVEALETRFLLTDHKVIKGQLIKTNIIYDVEEFQGELVGEAENKINSLILLENGQLLIILATTILADELAGKEPPIGRKYYRYHSKMTEAAKLENRRLFDDDPTGILVSSSAIGEGVNIPGLNRVLVVGTTYSLTKLIQFAARCGRGDGKGYCHIIYKAPRPDQVRYEDTRTNLVPLQLQMESKPLLTEVGLLRWVQQKDLCRIQTLATIFGEQLPNICKECDVCLDLAAIMNEFDAFDGSTTPGHNSTSLAGTTPGHNSTSQIAREITDQLASDAEAQKRERRNALMRKIYGLIDAKCLICNTTRCCSITNRVRQCIRLRDHLEAKEKIRIRDNRIAVSCGYCYEVWGGAPLNVLFEKRTEHNNATQESDARDGGICCQLPLAERGSPCHKCYFPHGDVHVFSNGRLIEGGHLQKHIYDRLRNILVYAIRVRFPYIMAMLGIHIGETSTFNSKYIELCKTRINSDLGAIPTSVLVINALVEHPEWNPDKPIIDLTY